MKTEFIELTDGTRLEIKINFGTMYYMQEIGANGLARKIETAKKKGKKASDTDAMKLTAKIIYAILRSNGKTVTFDEAMMLMPIDTDNIERVIRAYEIELKKLKKKQESKTKMKKYVQKTGK